MVVSPTLRWVGAPHVVAHAPPRVHSGMQLESMAACDLSHQSGLLMGLLLASEGGFSSTADDLAGSLFGASLFPWLAMLYWLKHPTVKAPPGVSFGLTYLLVFVFGSIPAAIAAGVLYDVSLADSDWLHGAAESLLAITNCVVVLGFRDALSRGVTSAEEAVEDKVEWHRVLAIALGVLAGASAVAVLASGEAGIHTPWLGGIGNLPGIFFPAEPPNALSIPTWIIHTSSLVEWLVAMGLAWRYADAARRPEWKGVTWGMLPLHTSGIIACTYHLFYNAPAVAWCVALQMGKEEASALLSAVLSSREQQALPAVQRESAQGVEAGRKQLELASTDEEATAGLVGWEDLGT
ncbi:MAG: hypothetical protein SGPRY_014247, partial [Prymnesium sp.]